MAQKTPNVAYYLQTSFPVTTNVAYHLQKKGEGVWSTRASLGRIPKELLPSENCRSSGSGLCGDGTQWTHAQNPRFKEKPRNTGECRQDHEAHYKNEDS
jgi:hypothetical protein